MKVPLVYKTYLDKFKLNSFDNKILTAKARQILSWYFRIPPEKVTCVLHEMHEMNLIGLANNKFIQITG